MHVFSTLIMAGDVLRLMSDKAGVEACIEWCRKSGVTKVYVESFRGGELVPAELLREVRDALTAAGLAVCGCVTTVSASSSGWDTGFCYTDANTRKFIQSIFEQTAEVFGEIMIDDYFFISCPCGECERARGGRSLADYRRDLMCEVARVNVLGAVKEVRPDANVIVKFPNWYDNYARRGYDVARQTELFDKIWVGNETREPHDSFWGAYPQYAAFFIQTWLEAAGGGKCGGGWYDFIGVKPQTYLEQARQTILGGAKESMLFCYGELIRDKNGIADTAALREELPELLKLAELTKGLARVGVSAPKKANCDIPGPEGYLPGYVGMLGIPLVGAAMLEKNARAVYLGAHALGFEDAGEYAASLPADIPVLATEEFLKKYPLPGAEVFRCGAGKWDALNIGRESLDAMRNRLLRPFGIEMSSEPGVSLHLFGEDCRVIAVENFLDTPTEVTLTLPRHVSGLLLGSGELEAKGKKLLLRLAPRSLAVL